jgi:putative ABC transport system permease protein
MGIRYALRTLRRSPAFSATLILTLALGIGASTAVFSAMDRLLLRSLPYPKPDRLVALHETQQGRGFRTVSLPNLYDWRAQSTSFDGIAAGMPRSFALREAGEPVTVVMVGMVTFDLFRTLGSGAHLGRTFTEREEFDDAALIVLTDELWARQFHRDPTIVGRTVQLNDIPQQVVGILPPDFVYPTPGTHIDAYIPISHHDYWGRAAKPLQAVARLKPGVTQAAAQAEFRTIGARLAAAWPAENPRGGADIESLDDAWKGSLRRPLMLLTFAALLLLAIVCTNVVNLILARALARAREMEIRVSLGARLADRIRQLLGEALLLSIAGGAVGLLLAGAILRGLPIVLKQPIDGLAIDTRALAFAAFVCLLATALCGLAPAFSTRRNRHPFRVRQALVVAQIALSLVLLLSTGAFLRVFVKLANRYPGFDTSHVVYFGFGLPEGRYTDPQMTDFHEKLRARLVEIPGVEAAGAVWRLPLNGRPLSTNFQFEGAGLPTTEWPAVATNIVDPSYFSALRIPLLKGRIFWWDTDRTGRPAVIVVNRAFEKAYGDVLGKRVQTKGAVSQIVGVVGDTYQVGLDQAIVPQIYRPVSQSDGLDGGDYVIRTARTDAALATDIAAAVASIDPNLEHINVRRLDTWAHNSLGDRRLPAILTALFAAIGLSLTALGLYGTIALEMGQRRKEMAIRVAVGATQANIATLVLRRAILLTAAGAIAGALAFVAVGRAIESQLYEVKPNDPQNAAIVVTILFASAIASSLGPAWRTLRQEPIAVLREN